MTGHLMACRSVHDSSRDCNRRCNRRGREAKPKKVGGPSPFQAQARKNIEDKYIATDCHGGPGLAPIPKAFHLRETENPNAWTIVDSDFFDRKFCRIAWSFAFYSKMPEAVASDATRWPEGCQHRQLHQHLHEIRYLHRKIGYRRLEC